MNAAAQGSIHGVVKALQKGADPNSQNEYGETALHLASMANDNLGISYFGNNRSIEFSDVMVHASVICVCKFLCVRCP